MIGQKIEIVTPHESEGGGPCLGFGTKILLHGENGSTEIEGVSMINLKIDPAGLIKVEIELLHTVPPRKIIAIVEDVVRTDE